MNSKTEFRIVIYLIQFQNYFILLNNNMICLIISLIAQIIISALNSVRTFFFIMSKQLPV